MVAQVGECERRRWARRRPQQQAADPAASAARAERDDHDRRARQVVEADDDVDLPGTRLRSRSDQPTRSLVRSAAMPVGRSPARRAASAPTFARARSSCTTASTSASTNGAIVRRESAPRLPARSAVPIKRTARIFSMIQETYADKVARAFQPDTAGESGWKARPTCSFLRRLPISGPASARNWSPKDECREAAGTLGAERNARPPSTLYSNGRPVIGSTGTGASAISSSRAGRRPWPAAKSRTASMHGEGIELAIDPGRRHETRRDRADES